MSIINNSYGFIFVHVPKTAGTSVTNLLSKYTNYCDIELGGTAFGEAIQSAYLKRFGLSKHSPASDIHSVVGSITWSKYFSFSIVRNPFARCLSTYHFLRMWEGATPQFADRMRKFESFDEYVLSDIWEETMGPDNIFRPQVSWLRTSRHKTDLLVNYVGKLEALDTDISYILDAIGIPLFKRSGPKLPQMNKSAPSATSEIQNQQVVERIVEKYKSDFQILGYPTTPT
jgi:hypothetical protein